MKSGNIPKQITYFDRPPSEYKRNYDDGTQISTPVIASSSFVSDANNEKTCKTAKKWATTTTQYGKSITTYLTEEEVKIHDSRWGIYFDHQKGLWYKKEAKKLDKPIVTEPETETVENLPFKGVRILSLEYRGNGGRAYKVLTGNRVFDLREDVLLDVMLNSKIENGMIDAEFIWCKVGSAMKLVRVDSSLYNSMAESTQFAHQAETLKDLVYGGVYKTKSKTIIYLGQHDSFVSNSERVYEDNNNWGRNYTYNYVLASQPKSHVFLEVSEQDLALVEAGNFAPFKIYYRFAFLKSKPKGLHIKDLEIPSIDKIIKTVEVEFVKEIQENRKKVPTHTRAHIHQIMTLDKTEEEIKKYLKELNK